MPGLPKKIHFEEGFLIREDYGDPTRSELVQGELNIVKSVSLIKQLGFLGDPEAYLKITNTTRRTFTTTLYAICVGDREALKLTVYAKQIVNVEFEGDTFTTDELVRKLYSEAKLAFEDSKKKFTRTNLGRYCLIRFSVSHKKYTNGDIAILASSNIKSETLMGMTQDAMPLEAILDMEDLPDSWLQTVLDKYS